VNPTQKYLIEEFVEEYHEHRMSRRELVRRAALIMGGLAAAASAIRASEQALAAVPALSVKPGPWPGNISGQIRADRTDGTNPPPAQTTDFVVPPDDPAIITEMVTFPGPAGDVRGYLARPAADGAYPGVVVIHENRGLVEPNMDIARRYAKLGYVALAPDLLSRVGGTEQFLSDLQAATGAIGQLGPDAPAADGNAAAAFLRSHPASTGAVGATGFCFGGGVVWLMALRNPDLLAIAPHYGPKPPDPEIPNLQAAALGLYAELDTRITSAIQPMFQQLADMGKTVELWIAPGANHAFFNNTGAAYHPADALEAWQRTISWFDRFLTGV